MNLRFLKTVIAISQHGSLAMAARSIGLSHSAVSLQISALEEELQFSILDRSRRPPVLTDEGLALVEHARGIQHIADEIAGIGQSDQLYGRIRLGAVPSTVSHLVAPALAQLNDAQPQLKFELTTALSGQLITRVLDREIDLALVTEPGEETEDLAIEPVCSEPYWLIVSENEARNDLYEILSSRPFIWFDRRSWLSRQVVGYLAARKIRVHGEMEVDSIEAVEALVAHDLGVSIQPQRTRAGPPSGVKSLSLGGSDLARSVALVSHKQSTRSKINAVLGNIFRGVAEKRHGL